MVKRIGEYSGIIGRFLGIIDNKLQLFLALKSRNYFDTSLKQCKHTLIKQSFASIEQPPTPKTANPESTFLKLGSYA